MWSTPLGTQEVDVMKVTLRRTLHTASGGVKLTRVITLLDGLVGIKYGRKMFYNIALRFTTVSYGHKRLYNIKHRWCWQMFRFLGCFKARRWASLVVVLHLRWNASFADFQHQ